MGLGKVLRSSAISENIQPSFLARRSLNWMHTIKKELMRSLITPYNQKFVLLALDSEKLTARNKEIVRIRLDNSTRQTAKAFDISLCRVHQLVHKAVAAGEALLSKKSR